MFKRLYETHINVRNLERSMSFYEYVGLERGAVDEARRVAFYFIGGWNDSMLGLWEKTPEENHELEILAKLPGNPHPDLGVIALPEWQAAGR